MSEAEPGRYRVRFSSRRAERELNALEESDFQRVNARIQALALDPRPVGSRLVHGAHNVYRIRVGRFRIPYRIDNENFEVIVGGVEGRGESTYQNLDRLF